MKINKITFENIEHFLYFVSLLNIEKKDNNYIFKQSNVRIFKYAVKHIIKLLCDKKVRLYFLSDYIQAIENICNYVGLKSILEKIEKYKIESEQNYPKDQILSKEDYTNIQLDSFYSNFLLYEYISYEQFRKINFLDYEEIIGALRRRDIFRKRDLLEVFSTANSNEEGFEKYIQNMKNELKEISKITFDEDKYNNDIMRKIYGK